MAATGAVCGLPIGSDAAARGGGATCRLLLRETPHATSAHMARHVHPALRRLAYATTFEAGGVLLSTAILLLMSGASTGSSLAFSIVASSVAMLWNLVFNAGFEAWESRQSVKGRGIARRIVHALLFEGGLVLLLIPLTAWWFSVTLIQALVYEAVLIVAFLLYTYAFTLVFDHLFGLPASAR